MHPVLILIPAAALMLGPELWVQHVLRQYNRKDEDSFNSTGGELARELLDRYRLHSVKVESTDLGDHYDPQAKAVRLTRDKIDRKTLTAITSAAHEVGHALQDAYRYPPFVWRTHVAKFAQVTGKAGSAMLFAAPIAALVSRNPVPPMVIGATAVAIMGTGLLAQVAALPSELDASFRRALPLLRDRYIDREQEKSVRKILLASTLTYIASSLAGVLGIWRWLPSAPRTGTPRPAPSPAPRPSPTPVAAS
ncbi:MAG: zinc metallopeptidase [Pseudomonadota bacterium]|nr:zinc metallopeptidase [Pseudomonadota bacterium]